MDKLTPYRKSRWRRLRARLPTIRTSLGATGPSVSFGDSHRTQGIEAVRILLADLTGRALFYASGELERPGEAVRSAEAIRSAVAAARAALPRGSALDASLELLQDACNTLRLDLRAKDDDWWPFGEALYEFRALVFQWAKSIQEETGLDEARRLAEKIDLSNARSPMGEGSVTIYAAPPRGRPKS